MDTSLHNENSKNAAAATRRWHKLINWNVHRDLVEKHLLATRDWAKNGGFFEALYVSQDRDARQIQLFAGVHPIGSVEVTRDAFGRPTRQKLHSEHGAALVFSQSTVGSVAVILYPYESEKLKQNTKHIIWGVFDDPRELTDAVIRRAVKDFLIYLRVTSALFNESTLDNLRIRYIEFRGARYSPGPHVAKFFLGKWFVGAMGIAGSFASIYSLWK
jgi:hypothetical protein